MTSPTLTRVLAHEEVVRRAIEWAALRGTSPSLAEVWRREDALRAAVERYVALDRAVQERRRAG